MYHLELQVITTPLLISTIHRSPQHPLSLFPTCCVLNSHSLPTAPNNGDSSPSRDNVITTRRISRNWTLVNCQLNLVPSLLSLSCWAQLNCQPSTNWAPGWRPFHTNLLIFSSQADFQLTTELVNLIVFKITPGRGPHQKHYSSVIPRVLFRGNVFTGPLLRNGLYNPVVLLLPACMLWALPSNGSCLQSYRLATGLYATILKANGH
jgi:hypothetical protein